MAQRVTVALEDDLNGGPADETVRFGVGAAQYEMYLTDIPADGWPVPRSAGGRPARAIAVSTADTISPGEGSTGEAPVPPTPTTTRSSGALTATHSTPG